jgi:hypothetical protein
MPRYWVIAPAESQPLALFDKVWQFDLANRLISIGWREAGDLSQMSREELSDALASAFPEKRLCKKGQGVRGLVICRAPDPKLSYALDMTEHIDVRF